MKITDPNNTQSPAIIPSGLTIFLTEFIWGHRLKSQHVNVLLVEFLGMVSSFTFSGNAFDETRPGEDVTYNAFKSEELRILLFNNPRMGQIANDFAEDNEKAWTEWKEATKQATIQSDFSYLQERFPKFLELYHLVELLRRIVLDNDSSREWTNKYLFPIGSSALYVELDKKRNPTRNYFTRTGEIAYLMLSRASEKNRLRLREGFSRIFQKDSQKNNLIRSLLKNQNQQAHEKRNGTYLPYKTHPAYERMAEDIAALLDLGLPEQDVFDPMKYLIALHLYLYAIETSNAWCNNEGLPAITCEILGPRMDHVRRMSGASKRINETQASRALVAFVEQFPSRNAEVFDTINDPNHNNETKAEALTEFFRKELHFESAQGHTVQEVKERVVAAGKVNCEKNIKAALSKLGKESGLVSKRGTNQLRYAPSDQLLRALILANVKENIEEKKFYEILHARYNFIISPDQAKHAIPEEQYEDASFKKNANRFTERLIALGFATKLSDACTYIKTPYLNK